ncbi:MAG: helicase-associated domain-containing protein [Pseudonocardia sp.]
MARKSSGLGAWLATLDAEQLLAVLRARPDAALAPEPGNPGELAARLATVGSVRHALGLLDVPALQLVEALLALGGRARAGELAELLGIDGAGAQYRFDVALAALTGLALAWPVGDELRLAGTAGELIADPLALGAPGRELFGQLTVAELERIGSGLGLGGFGRKAQWVEAVVAAVADPGLVAARLAHAPPALVAAVQEIAWSGPRVAGARLPGRYERFAADDLGVALAVQGWVVPFPWRGVAEMPREVALAVRGPGYHAPFDPLPPPPATAAVDAGRLSDASQHAAAAAVDAVRRLVAIVERTPPATLQAGGVGVRELRRLAKELSVDEAAARLWLEVAVAADLVAPTPADDVVPTRSADGWLQADPAGALAVLLRAWLELPIVPGCHLDDKGKPGPAVHWSAVLPGMAPLRADVLRELAALAADGRGLADAADPGPLARRLAHRRPLLTGAPEAVAPPVRATLTEAALLGLVADGALAPLGVAALDAAVAADPTAALTAAAAGLLPAVATTATFLPDLTAVVGGAVSPALARLLDEAADAETRDTASTWRFSAAGVRRALDAGRDADSLLTALRAVADNPLPQPLEYLVRDVARRHGELEVVPAACCVVVADAALAAEVAAHRRLAPLKLRRLGDSVLASTKSATDTLAALRAAGYAPVRRDAHGAAVVEKRPVRRAERRRPFPARFAPGGRAPGDLPALARRLAGGDVGELRA